MTRPRSRVRVLVTDGFWRKSLAAVRSLLRRDDLRVYAAERFRLAPALCARGLAGTLVHPSPLSRPRAFLRVLSGFLAAERIRILLPMEEHTLLLLLEHRALLPPEVLLPFGPAAVLRRARDKGRVLEQAASLGIPIPRTWTKRPPGPGEASFPVVVKPRVSSGARGLRFADGPEELDRAWREVAERFGPPLAQERLPASGPGAGVCLLLDEGGGVRASFAHRRLREWPLSGGASTLRESAILPELTESALRLLRSMDFQGVAMVEFKKDLRDGTYRLMEVNPRFWGSLALAVAAGVDFPGLAVDRALGRPSSGPAPYRAGVRCRWLLPGDLLHFLASPRRFRLDPPFMKFWGPDLHYDILSRRDPLPALARALGFLPLWGAADLRRFLRR